MRLSPGGTLEGRTSCSTYTARYIQNAGEIVVSHLAQPTLGFVD